MPSRGRTAPRPSPALPSRDHSTKGSRLITSPERKAPGAARGCRPGNWPARYTGRVNRPSLLRHRLERPHLNLRRDAFTKRLLALGIGKVETSGFAQPDPPHGGLGETTPAVPHDVQPG